MHTSQVCTLLIVIKLLLITPVASAHKDTNRQLLPERKIMEAVHNSSDSAFSIIQKELETALQQNNKQAIAFLYSSKGVLYYNTNENLTLEYYYKARKIYEELHDTVRLTSLYRAMGSLSLLSSKQRMDFLNKAMYLSKLKNDTLDIIRSHINTGCVYIIEENLDSGTFHFNKSLEYLRLYTDSTSEAATYSNLGQIQAMNKNYKKALEYFHMAHQKLPFRPDYDAGNHRIAIYLNLMNTHILTGQSSDSVFHYFKLIQESFNDRPKARMNAYILLSGFFEEKDPVKALHYLKKADSIKENQDKRDSFNALSLLELEYDSRLKTQKMSKLRSDIEKSNYIRAFLLITLFLLMISLYQMYKKKQAQREIMDVNLKNSQLRQEHLNEELKYANKELMSFATTIVENQNILDDLKNMIVYTSKKNSVKEMREQLKDIQITLHHVFQSDNYRQEFLKRSKEVNHSLVSYLKTNYKQLSNSDINILILLFLKFKSKEISILYKVEARSIEQRRRRLRQKLDMEKGEDFDNLFDRILEEIDLNSEYRTSSIEQ